MDLYSWLSGHPKREYIQKMLGDCLVLVIKDEFNNMVVGKTQVSPSAYPEQVLDMIEKLSDESLGVDKHD